METYEELSGDMALADEARTLAATGSDGWRQTTREALNVRREIVGLISRSVRDGSMPPAFIEPAAAARLVLIQNVVVLLSDLGDCSAASAAVRPLDEAAGSSDQALVDARASAHAAAAECVPPPPPVAVVGPEPEGDAAGDDSAMVGAAPEFGTDFDEGGGRRLAAPLTVGALSAGAFVVSAVAFSRVNSLGDDFDAYPDSDDPSLDGWTAIASDGQRQQRLGAAMLGIGAGLGIATAVVTVVRRDAGRDVEGSAARRGVRTRLGGDGFSMSW